MDMLTNIHSIPLYSVEGDNSEMYAMFFTSGMRRIVKFSPDSEGFFTNINEIFISWWIFYVYF